MGQHGTIQVEMYSADAAILTLRGEHDLESQPRVAAALTAAGVCPNVVVDLSDCTFADSSVIASLLRAARIQGERAGALALIVAPEASPIQRTLELMGIAAILPLHDSRATAVDAIAARPGPAALRPAA